MGGRWGGGLEDVPAAGAWQLEGAGAVAAAHSSLPQADGRHGAGGPRGSAGPGVVGWGILGAGARGSRQARPAGPTFLLGCNKKQSKMQ